MCILCFFFYIFLFLYLNFFFFFNDPSTTEIYTLSLHDALPIFSRPASIPIGAVSMAAFTVMRARRTSTSGSPPGDRKSTRLNSSHRTISYAVFCLKKKKKKYRTHYKRILYNH